MSGEELNGPRPPIRWAKAATPPADTASTGADVEGQIFETRRVDTSTTSPNCISCNRPVWPDASLTDAVRSVLREAGYLMPDEDVEIISDWLAAHDAATAERVRRETAEGIAFLMSGVGSHREPCRLPDTPCLCGVCEFREEAAQIAREQGR